MVTMVNIVPAKHQHVSIVTVSLMLMLAFSLMAEMGKDSHVNDC